MLIKLEEEEQKMVETSTSAIYNTKKFNDEIEEASKVVTKGIAQRMTRKKTVVCGLIAIAAYFIGFLPLIFSNTNTAKSFSFSSLITIITIAIFAAGGVIYLFSLRKKLINRFKHFNYVMSGICDRIRKSLDEFSEYLSHACMVMREKSALDVADTKETEDAVNVRVLKYNLSKLKAQIEENYKLLNDFSDEDVEKLLAPGEKDRITAFDYDYTRRQDFEYFIFENAESKEIEYMLKGHSVEIPMLCVEKVTLKREEFYD